MAKEKVAQLKFCPSNSQQDAIEFHQKMEQLSLKADDDTEIVIVSDTVRQRRSRTPISATSETNGVVVMPDLLPKTFRLAENSSLFSSVSKGETLQREENNDEAIPSTNDQQCSIVEIKELDLSSKMSIRNIDIEDDAKVGRVVDTINIFESCNNFEPQQVEMVNIIDASSDTDTATSTPQPSRKSWKSTSSAAGSMDELKVELKRELETVNNFTPVDSSPDDFCVKKQKISFDDHKKIGNGNDRDILHDSEIEEVKRITKMKFRPTLKELLMEERDSFYSADNDNDEPLEFSDDEEIPRYSIEMDSDSDVVAQTYIFFLILISSLSNYWNFQMCYKHFIFILFTVTY